MTRKFSNISKDPRSFSVVLIMSILLVFTVLNIGHWKRGGVIVSDIQSYYSYLPAIFIYDDISFQYKFDENTPDVVKNNLWYLETPDGEPVQKMSSGLALLYSPFFFIANSTAESLGYDPNGYSPPYQLALTLSSVFYAIVSMFVMRAILMRFFSDTTSATTIAILYAGTNLFYYIMNESAMSHNYSVFIITLIIYSTLKWGDSINIKRTFFTGLLCGLAVLVRPINGLVVLFPIIYFLVRSGSIKDGIDSLLDPKVLFPAFFGGFLGVLPQLIYWKVATGDWVYYSYNEEGFFFSDPEFWKGLFSFRKGWLIYTPLMMLGLIGLIPLYKRHKALAIPTIVILPIYMYVIFSWWCWWYGGSFGMRAMIDMYPFLAFGLAACVHWVLSQRKTVLTVNFYALIALGIGLNQWQTYQYRKGIIHWDGMTKEAYRAVFWHDNYPPNYDSYIQRPDYDAAKRGDR